jgi:hypothetical protein
MINHRKMSWSLQERGNSGFSNLDLKSGYLQVALHPNDKEESSLLDGPRVVASYGQWSL